MILSKDDRRLEVTDKAHIDCLTAKGWKKVEETVKSVETVQVKKQRTKK